jgi:hypothetical protein
VFSDGEIITIGGVPFTMKTALGGVAGQVLIGANLAASLTNLAAAVNASAGAGTTYVELSTANRTIITDTLRLTTTAGATTITLVGVGSGRLSLAETGANFSWTSNFVHAYAGQAGGIDVVIQQDPKVTLREEPKQRTTNYLNDALYGVKVFDDRAKTFVDLQISAT